LISTKRARSARACRTRPLGCRLYGICDRSAAVRSKIYYGSA